MSFFVAYFYNRLLLVCCRENNVNVFMSSMCSRLFEKLCKHYLAEYLVCGDSCVSYCADWEPQLCRRRSSEDWKQNSKHGVKTELSTIELQERHVQVKSRQRFSIRILCQMKGTKPYRFRILEYKKRNCSHMTMTCQNHPLLPLDRHLPRDYSQLPRDLDLSQLYLWSFVQQQDPLQHRIL